MLIAGIAGSEDNQQAANLINNILSSQGIKISVIDSKSLGSNIGKIKEYILEVEKNKTDILLLKLNINDVEEFYSNDIHFDVMVFPGNSEIKQAEIEKPVSGELGKLFLLLKEKGTAIVNADDGNLIRMLRGIKQNIVTYGFNTRANVTTSSIGDILLEDSFICCQQETISAKNGMLMEPQEYKLKLDSGELDTHDLLAAASFALVNGVDLNNKIII